MAAQTMFAPLSVEELEVAAEAKPAASSTKRPIIPVPDDAPPCEFCHPRYGAPTGAWAYHQADGALVGYAARFDFTTDGKPHKVVQPITYCAVSDGKREYCAWRFRGGPEPRPLYRLRELLAEPSKPVIISEGEKKADRAVKMFPDCVATTTIGGAKAPRKTDFAPLAGRQVIIWPDNDDPGGNTPPR